MVQLTTEYNPAEHDSFQEGFGIIEDVGPHQVQIIEDTEEYTKDGAARMSCFVIEIMEGEYKGRKVWERLLVECEDHATDKTKKGVKFGLQKLRDYCTAVVHTDLLRDTNELMYRPFLAMVEIEPAKGEYKAKNKLGKLFPLGGAQPPADKPAVQPAAKQTARPAAAAGASKPASAPAAGGPVRPWNRPGAGAGAPAAG